jgi:cytosine/adenosine deaminase-related metal-dependent hydrolase
MRRLSSHLLLTPRGLEPGRVVTVTESGEVADISAPEALDRQAGVEFYPGVLVPGFFNAHCHLELSHLRGVILAGGGFEEFVRGMKSAPRGGGEAAAEFWDARMWAEGVSAVADICNGESTFPLKARSPIRYHSFREIFGAGATVPEPNEPAGGGTDNDTDNGTGGGRPENTPSLTPHSLYSLDRQTFARIVERSSGVLSIHFMESAFEVADPAAELVARVPADRPVMLVHNCLVTQRDIDIVMGHFTAPVTWVLCPGSNRHISGLTPPVDLLRRNGLRIAVGTDSLASNDTLSMVRELHLLAAASTDTVPLAELLGWAAADTISPGRTPGLVLLTGIDFEKMALTDASKSERIL